MKGIGVKMWKVIMTSNLYGAERHIDGDVRIKDLNILHGAGG